jgi:hypothetical protein
LSLIVSFFSQLLQQLQSQQTAYRTAGTFPIAADKDIGHDLDVLLTYRRCGTRSRSAAWLE